MENFLVIPPNTMRRILAVLTGYSFFETANSFACYGPPWFAIIVLYFLTTTSFNINRLTVTRQHHDKTEHRGRQGCCHGSLSGWVLSDTIISMRGQIL
jgi:hypothetical protein